MTQSKISPFPKPFTLMTGRYETVPVVREDSGLGHKLHPFKSRMVSYDPHLIMGADVLARGKM